MLGVSAVTMASAVFSNQARKWVRDFRQTNRLGSGPANGLNDTAECGMVFFKKGYHSLSGEPVPVPEILQRSAAARRGIDLESKL